MPINRRRIYLIGPLVAAVLVVLSILIVVLATRKSPNGSTPATADDSPSYRLPTDLKPIIYNLTLAPYIYSQSRSDFYFTGSVQIIVQVLKTTKEFKLHSYGLNISSFQVKNSTVDHIKVFSMREDVKKQWLSVTLDDYLYKGNNYTISIHRFRGNFGFTTGLYVVSFSLEENGTRRESYLAASQLEPTFARYVFPCFDEPEMKAQFDVSLIKSEYYEALSNMPRISQAAASKSDWFNDSVVTDAVVIESFERTPIMSTYLLAFLVAKFHSVGHFDIKNRFFGTWLRPQLLDESNFSHHAASLSINVLENLLGVPYDMQVTKQVGVPIMLGAGMENWGLILYEETQLINEQIFDTTETLTDKNLTISHEMAHQWFGNMVTMKWWNELWLKEAFATFYSYLGLNYPLPDVDSTFVHTQRQIMDHENRFQSHPIEMNVSTPHEIWSIFNFITYNKGASVVRMMYNSIGDRAFGAGITQYLRTHRYSNTGADDLYAILNAQIKTSRHRIDVGQAMRSWVLQTSYPLITCSIINGSILLKQQELTANNKNVTSNSTWIIPITSITNLNYSQWDGLQVSHLVHWMSAESYALPIHGQIDWYLLNLRSTGHYQVNYDQQNWHGLVDQLIRNHSVFTATDRAALLHDSIDLASLGLLDSSVPIKMVKGYLKKEIDFAPWKIFWQKYAHIEAKLSFKTLESIVKPVFDYVTQNKFSADQQLKYRLQALILRQSCSQKFYYCTDYARKHCPCFHDSKLIAPHITNSAAIRLFCPTDQNAIKLPPHLCLKSNNSTVPT